MFAALEWLAGGAAIWFFSTLKTGEFLKGLLTAAIISGVAQVLLILTVTRLRALYVLLAFAISAGWAWIGFKLAPMIYNDPNAPLYGAVLLGGGSLLEKFLAPQNYLQQGTLNSGGELERMTDRLLK